MQVFAQKTIICQ